jgi:hypothetical protein
MSIISLHAHFPIDRESLHHLCGWFVDIGRTTSAATTMDGVYKKARRHYHKMLAAFTATLNEEQKEELHEAVKA